MFALNKEKAQKILLSQGFSLDEVNRLLTNYPLLPDEFENIVNHWFENQSILAFEISGISISEVIEKRKSHFLVAIRDMSRLLDPGLSKEKIDQWRRILQTPVFYE